MAGTRADMCYVRTEREKLSSYHYKFECGLIEQAGASIERVLPQACVFYLSRSPACE